MAAFYYLLLLLAWLACAIQLFFWCRYLSRLQVRATTVEQQPPVSVIICAKNESANLQQFLPKVLQQKYPTFEVLVVDDYSEDNTAAILQAFATTAPHLTILTPRTGHFPDHPGKKAALQAGIRQARHDWLLLTDADCEPASPEWIAQVMAARTAETKIVLGYGPYRKRPGWLNRFIRFETSMTALTYLGFAQAGRPYMGVGRNLLYHKALLHGNPSALRPELISGDDDLLVNGLATPKNCEIALSSQGWTWSPAIDHWRAYLHQKRRHLSTGKQYGRGDQIRLGALAMSQAGLYALALAAFFLPAYWRGGILVAFLLRLMIAWWVFGKKTALLGVNDLKKWFPFLDFLQVLYFTAMSPYIFFFQPKTWSGRNFLKKDVS